MQPNKACSASRGRFQLGFTLERGKLQREYAAADLLLFCSA